MKTLKLFCVLGLFSLFFSCAYQEDRAAFFIDNELSNSLTIDGLSDNSFNPSIRQSTVIDITSSDSYRKYIRRLKDIDIVELKFNFKDYQGDIRNGKLFIDNVFLGDFDIHSREMSVEDATLVALIENRFLEKKALDVYFTGESDDKHYLLIDVEIMIKGTFVH